MSIIKQDYGEVGGGNTRGIKGEFAIPSTSGTTYIECGFQPSYIAFVNKLNLTRIAVYTSPTTQVTAVSSPAYNANARFVASVDNNGFTLNNNSLEIGTYDFLAVE